MPIFIVLISALVSIFFCGFTAAASETTYQKPAKEIEEILEAKLPPIPMVNPTRDSIVFYQLLRNPPISVLSEPMQRLGGLRLNTLTNGESNYPMYGIALSIKKIPDGDIRPITIPADARIGRPYWNAIGTDFVFTNETHHGIELWVANGKTAKAHKIPGMTINPLLSSDRKWLPDHETLLVKMIPQGRKAPPTLVSTPVGPRIEESSGVKSASSTYEVRDVLNTPHDADLFDYYTTSQLALVNTKTNKIRLIGKPGVYEDVQLSPDAKHLLVSQLQRPYSYKRTYSRFPKGISIWSLDGKVVEHLADMPLAEAVPIRGIPTGPRDFTWISTKPATIVWTEALDGGDPKNKVPHRDKIMAKDFGQKDAHELLQTEERFEGFDFIEGGLALVHERNDDKHWIRIFLVDLSEPTKLQLVNSLSEDDHYQSPGSPFYRTLASEVTVVKRFGDWIYRAGAGASPVGDRPFLDRLNLKTLKSERLFRCDADHLENVIALIDDDARTFLTRRESPIDPPNVQLRTLDKKPLENVKPGESQYNSSFRAITSFADPMPQIRGITKQLVNYERPDGVKLSFTLYLPPGYKPGTKLPTVFYAYPLDYTEQGVAGQVTGSTKNFTVLGGTSHLFFLLEGYAVLDNVAMPIVGPSAKIYDTYMEQLVEDAKAAIKKAVELGVTDPTRVGVLGHSHGAMMTANLLAHSDLFRAGIARSGAYNKTLTMFGFQNEKRSLFEARDVYFKVSPTLHAEDIKKPLLLIHGEIDSNPGTIPLQSQLLYEAIRGTGGTVRLVMLPSENHGYIGKESSEHVLYEMTRWFDKYVKGD